MIPLIKSFSTSWYFQNVWKFYEVSPQSYWLFNKWMKKKMLNSITYKKQFKVSNGRRRMVQSICFDIYTISSIPCLNENMCESFLCSWRIGLKYTHCTNSQVWIPHPPWKKMRSPCSLPNLKVTSKMRNFLFFLVATKLSSKFVMDSYCIKQKLELLYDNASSFSL